MYIHCTYNHILCVRACVCVSVCVRACPRVRVCAARVCANICYTTPSDRGTSGGQRQYRLQARTTLTRGRQHAFILAGLQQRRALLARRSLLAPYVNRPTSSTQRGKQVSSFWTSVRPSRRCITKLERHMLGSVLFSVNKLSLMDSPRGQLMSSLKSPMEQYCCQ